MEFRPGTAGFFALNDGQLSAERKAGQRHQFLSVEFGIPFLQRRLASHSSNLHPLIRRCLDGAQPLAGFSGVNSLTHRHRDLLNSLLHPPVLASAQPLWYEIKALEFAAEFFFSAGAEEKVCTRAQQLAAERVARAKRLLLENLADPPALAELGRCVGCSHFYLSRTFTRETGVTISQWLRQARLEQAAELLRSGKCNVTEAALEVGYSSLSHFSEAFHEMYGCCPCVFPLRNCTQQQASPELAAMA
jgi:AraC-like DNA-binding protein